MPRSIGRAVRAAAALAAVSAALALPAAAPAATPAPSELPSCAEGPEVVGGVVLGTPCDDRIVAPATATAVDGGPGDDVIVGANSAAVPAQSGDPSYGLHLEVGSQTFNGGPGNDVVYGDRGNDVLRGNQGNDRLYGGIGDDVLEGGEGDDLLAGGFGADKIDGQVGNDFVRGDATIDKIFDTGGGFDTLSFATGVTPGFTAASNPTGAASFPGPGPGEERGVWLRLGQGGSNAIDGEPSLGGGNDEVQPGVFERIVGTPFSDYIEGGPGDEQIYGGGGADVIKGGEGNDLLNGGADGDYLDGGPGANAIESGTGDNCFNPQPSGCGSASSVAPRSRSKVSVGETSDGLRTAVYVIGSENGETINVSSDGVNVSVSISGASFDADAAGCSLSGTTASCPVSGLLDSVLIAGKGGNDALGAAVPDGVSVVELGGEGSDNLSGSGSEDTLVDGPGAVGDTLAAGPGDDALTHNAGPDTLDGGEGSDLFLSVSLCEGETINGGAPRVGAPVPDRDNASWARLPGAGVDARLDLGVAGRVPAAGESPDCAGAAFDSLVGIEDLEGSSQSDVLYGNEENNQLLGHQGADGYFALGGSDLILANSRSVDRVINCGPGSDQAVIDLVSILVDPTPIECELVREGAPEEFNELPLLSEPAPPPPPPAVPPPDRKPPLTKLLRHPGKTLKVLAGRRKQVAFRFASSEAGSRFRCRLDRKRYASCRSPRKYRVTVGRHVFRVFAIDRAGNRDRSPSVFQFRVVPVKRHGPKR